MPYLNLDLDYFTHPKIVRLVGLLGQEHVAMPIRLWAYVAKHHCEDGMLEGYSKHELESAACWPGESGKFVDAMVKIGLIEEIENGYAIHDWLEHAGHLAAFKKRAKTAAKKRWKKYASSIAKRKITNTPTLPTLPTLPTKEESVARATSDDEWIASLKANPVFSGLDIDHEYRKAQAWIVTKGNGRKFTRKFFGGWLVKALGDKPMAVDARTVATTCAWKVQQGVKTVPCGKAIAPNQHGPPRPFCEEHLKAREALDRQIGVTHAANHGHQV